MAQTEASQVDAVTEARGERIRAEITRRIRLQQRLADDPEAQAAALARYQDDLCQWVDDWAWTLDPRLPTADLPAYIPMQLVGRQREYLQWRQRIRSEGKDGQVPKSRGVGASYLLCAHHLWCWLFEDGFSGTLVSDTEDAVDKRDDPDSLFGKLRIMLDNLPGWMLPDGWQGVGYTSPHDNHRRLVNPQTGATIVGEIGQRAGQSGRSAFADVDEAAHCEHLKTIRRGLRENAPTVFETSTYAGMGDPFYERVHSDSPAVETFQITWQDIPWYDEEWYAKKQEQYADDPVGLAQEIDCDPTKAAERVVIQHAWVDAAREWQPPDGVTEQPKFAGMDVAGRGEAETVLCRRHGPRVLGLRGSQEASTTQAAYWARDLCEAWGITDLGYDAVGIGAGVGDTLEADSNALTLHAFVAGSQPSEMRWPNGKTSRERFNDAKAEAWWIVRDRLRKTWEVVECGEDHPPEECMSLPPEGADQLYRQLAQPQYEYTGSGKIKIQSKAEMDDEGLGSPDRADSVVMAFYAEAYETDAGWSFA